MISQWIIAQLWGEERREYIYNGLILYQQRKLADKNPNISEEELMSQSKTYADGQIDKYAPIPWCGFTDWNKELFQKDIILPMKHH